MTFDPNAAATSDGLFGLPTAPGDAHVVVVPVPFDATTSYRDGTRDGPAAVLEASLQVDLFDLDFGKPYERGLAMLPLEEGAPRQIAALNREARRYAEPVIAAGGVIGEDAKLGRALLEVNRRSARMNELVETTVAGLLARGRMAVVLGGDHSTPFGAIKAYAARHPGLGILHIDAHADLRAAYEGFEWSHASIMHNVVTRIGRRGGVATLVQVGIRDFCEDEYALIQASSDQSATRIVTHFDTRLQESKMGGVPFRELADKIIADLPEVVYLSVDIDGLDPSLCPDTGTPVPGGLALNELWELLRAMRRAGRRIVGFDLNEVAPSRTAKRTAWGKDWNANVGARVLYKLIGAALATSPAKA